MREDKSNFMMPLSIVIAGLLVAGAVYMTNGKSGDVAQIPQPNIKEESGIDLEAFAPVTEKDHIIGDINAPVVIVEYSDLECPFCARVHPTIESIVDEYDGKVAWVFRHFPLSQIHPNAAQLAIASECVANKGGNEKFWSFIDGIFENETKGEEAIVTLATQLGVDGESVRTCINSDEYQNDVLEDVNSGATIGVQGTPFVVVVGPDDVKASINGAQPIEVFRQVVDTMLAQ